MVVWFSSEMATALRFQVCGLGMIPMLVYCVVASRMVTQPLIYASEERINTICERRRLVVNSRKDHLSVSSVKYKIGLKTLPNGYRI